MKYFPGMSCCDLRFLFILRISQVELIFLKAELSETGGHSKPQKTISANAASASP